MLVVLSATACASKADAIAFDGGVVVYLNLVSIESTQPLSLLIVSTQIVLNDDIFLSTSGVVSISSSCFD